MVLKERSFYHHPPPRGPLVPDRSRLPLHRNTKETKTRKNDMFLFLVSNTAINHTAEKNTYLRNKKKSE